MHWKETVGDQVYILDEVFGSRLQVSQFDFRSITTGQQTHNITIYTFIKDQ